MVPTPEVEPSRSWQEAMDGFRFDLLSRNRSANNIRTRLCTTGILARHSTADGREPGGVDKPYMVAYLIRQY